MVAGGLWGYANGGLTATGIILVAILMSGGVHGAPLVATDAIISVIMGVSKVMLFGGLSALDVERTMIGLLIGFCTAPGAFVARALSRHLPACIHAGFMEVIVIIGALSLLWQVDW